MNKIDIGPETAIESRLTCNLLMTTRGSLPATELVPIGLYDGGELLLGCYILDDSYTVYVEILNPELSEVMKTKVKARCKLCDKEIEVWIKNNKGKYGWYCGDCFSEIGFTLTEKVDSKAW